MVDAGVISAQLVRGGVSPLAPPPVVVSESLQPFVSPHLGKGAIALSSSRAQATTAVGEGILSWGSPRPWHFEQRDGSRRSPW